MTMVTRRAFVARAGASLVVAASATLVARTLRAQGAAKQPAISTPVDMQVPATQSAASNVEMTSDSYKSVRRPPKRDATRLMNDAQIQAFERQLACPCPCTLDVYTCRTTDFTCGISPAVHRDVQTLVEGGYSADEIMNAMLDTYGDFILMEPRKQGFNLLAWIAPAAALVGGALGIGALLRGWRRNAAPESASNSATTFQASTEHPLPVDATADELAVIDAALRDDRR